MYAIHCPRCQQRLPISPDLVGKKILCGACGQKIRVPTLEQFEEAARQAPMPPQQPAPMPPQPPWGPPPGYGPPR